MNRDARGGDTHSCEVGADGAEVVQRGANSPRPTYSSMRRTRGGVQLKAKVLDRWVSLLVPEGVQRYRP